MAIRKLPVLRLYAPIVRIDEEKRLVEGYCYCNAEVGDGVNLTRQAMEAAAADYMRWGAVREMHQPSAVGTAKALEFDEQGAFLRAHIVDDVAWDKVRAGVYKGFSVNVKPIAMRGNQVQSCTWIENSLVDRPADPDAVITLFRAEGAQTDAEYEVEDIERGRFADLVTDREPRELLSLAFLLLSDCLWQIANGADAAGREAQARSEILEFADYVAPVLAAFPEPPASQAVFWAARGDLDRLVADTALSGPLRDALSSVQRAMEAGDVPVRENLEGGRLPGRMHYDCGSRDCHAHLQHAAALRCQERAADPVTEPTAAVNEEWDTLQNPYRVQVGELERAQTELVTRAEQAEGDLAGVRRQLATAIERVQILEQMPLSQRPVQFPAAIGTLDREFLVNSGPRGADLAAKIAELARIQAAAKSEPDAQKRQQMAAAVIRLQAELSTY